MLNEFGTFYMHGGTIPAYEIESMDKQVVLDAQDYFNGCKKREITQRKNGSWRWRVYGTPVIKAILDQLPYSLVSPRKAKLKDIVLRSYIAKT